MQPPEGCGVRTIERPAGPIQYERRAPRHRGRAPSFPEGRGVAFHKPLMITTERLRGFEISDPDGYILFFDRPDTDRRVRVFRTIGFTSRWKMR
jgi:hypothetical protein